MRAAALVAVAAASGGAAGAVFDAAVDVQGWTRGARAAGSEAVPLIVSLRGRGGADAAVAARLRAASDPASPRYGRHLSAAALGELAAPPPGAARAVAAWLAGHGIVTRAGRWGDRLHADAPAAAVEAAFSTQVHRFHAADGRSALQALDVHVPDDVRGYVAAVHGLHGVPARPRRTHVSAGADYKATPSFLRQYYNVSGVAVARPTKNKQAAVEFQGQALHAENVATFFKQYVPDAQPGDEKYACVGSSCEPESDTAGDGTEAALDMEYIMGVAPGVPTEMWYYSASQFCYDLKNWTAAVLDAEDPPLVFSVSYGIQGNVSLDKAQGCQGGVVMDIERDFTKIAARGITIVFASGDDGAAGTSFIKSKLWPSWPGGAPHVTAVGSTTFVDQKDPSAGEQATTKFGSGGGFSWRWPVQDWQKQQAADYLAWSDAAGDTPKEADFMRSGRATPEVAGLGEGYQVVHGNPSKPATSSVGGTSASAPLFAAMVSLLNEHRLQKGKSSLGFINPLIYAAGAKGKAFRDVTVGNNRKDSGGNHLSQGWYCREGWDAVTGYGTPNFAELLAYVDSLP